MQKDTIYLYVESKVKIIKLGSRIAVAEGSEGNGEMFVKGYRASVMQNE